MFSREELRTRHLEYRERAFVSVERTVIPCPSWEAEGIVHRGYKTFFDGPLHWWVNSQRAIEQTMASYRWLLVEPDEALCQPVDEARFLELMAECLTADFFTATVKPLGDFGGAMMMHDEWSDHIAIAEFADRYYATYWFTSG